MTNPDFELVEDEKDRYKAGTRGSLIVGVACSVVMGFYRESFVDGVLLFIAIEMLFILEVIIDLKYYQEEQAIRRGSKCN